MSENYTSIATQPPQLAHHLVKLLESKWDAYFDYMDNDILATGLLVLAVHELTYFGRGLPWYVIDQIPWFRKYKIQQNKIPKNDEYWACFKSVMLSHLFVEMVPIFGFYGMCKVFGITLRSPFPSFTSMAGLIIVFLLLEDAWHYWGHRALHTKYLYKSVHKQHHKYAAPFGITAEYAHPVEVAFTGIGTVGSPLLWAYFTGDLHLLTVLIWIAVRLLQAVDSHSGYDFPWSLRHFVPMWAGADHHDDHHKYFTGNYASSFRMWDYCLGTETKATETKREKRAHRS